MTKRHPGRIPQTALGSELLGVRRTPSPWARRLLLASAVVAVLALLILAASLLSPRGDAVRERPEVHVDHAGVSPLVPGRHD